MDATFKTKYQELKVLLATLEYKARKGKRENVRKEVHERGLA